MLPFKKILCPIDFSDFSLQALDQAGELAAHFGAQLCVLHVTQSVEMIYVLAPYGGGAPSDIVRLEREVRKGAKHELQRILKREGLQQIAVQPFLLEGNAADKIVDVAEQEGADLLVISTHGRSGWRHLVFGSVAEKVVRLAPCPVLVVHARKLPAADAAI